MRGSERILSFVKKGYNRAMVKVTLKRNEGRTISAGGLWIFDNEIEKIEGEYQNGDIVEVVSYKDDHIGKGYINDHSKIIIRKDAWEYRKAVVETNCCRIVFSDSDRLPGLIVDKFNEYLVFEIDTLGMDVRKDMLVKQMLKVMEDDGVTIHGVYERSDARVRTLEGLERVKGFLSEPFDTLIRIDENGVMMNVNIADRLLPRSEIQPSGNTQAL